MGLSSNPVRSDQALTSKKHSAWSLLTRIRRTTDRQGADDGYLLSSC